MFISSDDIEFFYEYHRKCSCLNFRKGITLLYRLEQAVNDQSDGWAYWKAPRVAATKLVELLKTGADQDPVTISEADLRKAVSPIRRMVTVQTKKQAEYGNTFNFNVDQALAEVQG